MIDMHYINKKEIRYWSPRYKKWIVVEEGFKSDGATGAIDIYSEAWWVHDKVKETEKFNDGTPCTNRQASMILYDILRSEGRKIRAPFWCAGTYLWGEAKNVFF